MNRLLIIVIMTLGAPVWARGQSVQEEKGAAAEILALEARRFRAMAEVDVPTLEKILADDMTYSHSTGLVQTKPELIKSLQSGEMKYESIISHDPKVRLYGTTAVVTGRATVILGSGGEPGIELRYLDVYVKQSAGWRMVAWQSARLAP